MEPVKFNELEDRIKGIIEDYSLLKKRNLELEDAVRSKEGELEDLKDKVRVLTGERDSVRTKVDSLLEMLQNIPV